MTGHVAPTGDDTSPLVRAHSELQGSGTHLGWPACALLPDPVVFTSSTIRVGHTGMQAQHVVENVIAVAEKLSQKLPKVPGYRGVGGGLLQETPCSV